MLIRGSALEAKAIGRGTMRSLISARAYSLRLTRAPRCPRSRRSAACSTPATPATSATAAATLLRFTRRVGLAIAKRRGRKRA